jgi:hypothetical protein
MGEFTRLAQSCVDANRVRLQPGSLWHQSCFRTRSPCSGLLSFKRVAGRAILVISFGFQMGSFGGQPFNPKCKRQQSC